MKRLLDILISGVSLIVLAPVLLILCLLVRVCIGRPVFFTRPRPGRSGVIFRMHKFRTMLDLRDAEGRPLPDAERMTRCGRFLRHSSLDELPQLYNVLRGDMSLVGPRPLLVEYLERYTPEQSRRHEVRPGVTGWAQINGRNDHTWPERLQLDVWYVDHRSMALDLKILALTVLKVIRREGINASGHATMPEFKGNFE